MSQTFDEPLNEVAWKAFHAQLKAAFPLLPSVERNIGFTLSSVQVPAIIAYDGQDRVQRVLSGRQDMHTDVAVHVVVDSGSRTAHGPAVNKLAAQVQRAIAQDVWLGMAPGVEDTVFVGSEEIVLPEEENGPPRAGRILTFRIERYQSETDPFSLP